MIDVRRRLGAAGGTPRRLALLLERVRPAYVVAAFVVAQWLVTLGIAVSVRHTRWLYYHGGDQAWFYTTSHLLTKGLLAPTNVGYGWSIVLLPFSLVSGPDLVSALPAIILLNLLVLMPLTMAAMYGIGAQIGGRLFGYWVLLLWIVLPLIGIKYTDTGFKQRYTELTLPDAYGLTSLSDFPTTVGLVVAAYFCLQALRRSDWTYGALAGALAGVAIGIKPSSSLFLGGAVLVFVGCRRWRQLGAFAAGLAPFVVALTVWKWRGLGYVPLFHADQGMRLAAGSMLEPVGAIHLGKYINLNWHQLGNNIGSLQEHFWSARVAEWTLLAGTLALLRRGRAPLLLFGGWFWAFVLIKGTGNLGSLETGGLLHMLIPAIPAFVVMIACLPLLYPGFNRRLPPLSPTDAGGSPNRRLTLLFASVLLFAVVPVALAASSTKASNFAYAPSGPIPVVNDLHVTAKTLGNGYVRLRWKKPNPSGGPIFFEILRATGTGCRVAPFYFSCFTVLDTTLSDVYTDRVAKGGYLYTIALGANWVNDPKAGDIYLASPLLFVQAY